MWEDPIIAEIHRTREKLSQAYGDDLHAIFLAAQRGELAKGLLSQAGVIQDDDKYPQPEMYPTKKIINESGRIPWDTFMPKSN